MEDRGACSLLRIFPGVGKGENAYKERPAVRWRYAFSLDLITWYAVHNSTVRNREKSLSFLGSWVDRIPTLFSFFAKPEKRFAEERVDGWDEISDDRFISDFTEWIKGLAVTGKCPKTGS